MNFQRIFCAIVPLLAACGASGIAFAQDKIPVRLSPPMQQPECALPPDQRLPFLWQFIQGDAPLTERRAAFRRALLHARDGGDAATIADWDERWRRFVAQQETQILASHPNGMPNPPALCNPDAPETDPARQNCDNFRLIDNELGLEHELLAEAAKHRGDMARYIAHREAEILFSRGTRPHGSHWLALAREATRVGVYDAALRFCGVLEMRHYREFYRDFDRGIGECRANARFGAHQWAEWLAYFEPQLAWPGVGNTRLLVRYCVAATRAGRGETAERACEWASQSVRMRDAELNRRARAATRSSLEAVSV